MENQPEQWTAVYKQMPPENVVVETMISDSDGVRNVAMLKLKGKLWWFADGSMYVYYVPTHWRHAN